MEIKRKRTFEEGVRGPNRFLHGQAGPHRRPTPEERAPPGRAAPQHEKEFTMSWRHSLSTATMLAFAVGVLAPSGADAQVRERKQRTRITSEQRKASAEARKAKMTEAKRLNPGVKYAHGGRSDRADGVAKKSDGGGR